MQDVIIFYFVLFPYRSIQLSIRDFQSLILDFVNLLDVHALEETTLDIWTIFTVL